MHLYAHDRKPITLLLTPWKQKMVDYVRPKKRLNVILNNLELNGPKVKSEETLTTNCGVNNRPIFPPKVSKEAQLL